jgi:hypothetical protein
VDGTLVPAIDVVNKNDFEKNPSYIIFGTMGMGDLAVRFSNLHNGLDPYESVCISGKDGSWKLDFEFSIDEKGNHVF